MPAEEGISYKEIAATLGTSLAAAKMKAHRARLKLAGEASADPRALVEDYLKPNPALAREVEPRAVEAAPAGGHRPAAGAAPPPARHSSRNSTMIVKYTATGWRSRTAGS